MYLLNEGLQPCIQDLQSSAAELLLSECIIIWYRGTVHSLRPREIAFVLPGNEYTQDDLHHIQQLAESKAEDKSLMQDAWEVRRFQSKKSCPFLTEVEAHIHSASLMHILLQGGFTALGTNQGLAEAEHICLC